MFTAPAVTEGGDFNPLTDGCYEAIVVGLRGFTGTKYQSTELEDKMQFIFQVQDDDGVLHYLGSKPLSNVLNEKSNLFKVLNGITGYGLDKFPIGFNYGVFVNAEKPVKCQIVVKTVPGKKDPSKTYNEIDSYLKAKKGQRNTFVPDDKAPAWLNQNVKEVIWMPGLSFQAPTAPKQAIPAVPQGIQQGDPGALLGANRAPGEIPSVPFSPVPGQAPVQASPYVAPIQANGQPYVPPAAPAPQPTFQSLPGTATTAAGNTYATQQAQVFQAADGMDLPF